MFYKKRLHILQGLCLTVRVRDTPDGVGDVDAADDERKALLQAVQVPAMPNPERKRRRL